jgi:spore germination cell wall hydrolase CwlJ-like protein
MKPLTEEQMRATNGRVFPDRELLARTAWGEYRGGGRLGMQSVINVIMNRVNRDYLNDGLDDFWGEGIAGVVLTDRQFSAWNIGDPNREQLLNVDETDPEYRIALELADLALAGALPDVTGGADHYHRVEVRPFWANPSKQTARVLAHVFYRLG